MSSAVLLFVLLVKLIHLLRLVYSYYKLKLQEYYNKKNGVNIMPKKLTFQEIILTLQQFWNDQGCMLMQAYDNEKGAEP